MKKTLRTVVASLLLLVMLFSVSVTTIFAAEDLSSPSDDGAGSFDPITPPTESSGASLNLGWLDVSYDNSGISIVWNHDFRAMLETMIESPEKIEELSTIMTDAIEHLVLGALSGGSSEGGSTGSGTVIDIDINDLEGLLKTAINAYLGTDSTQDGYINTILNFFKGLLGEDMSDADSEAHKFAAYVCSLIHDAVALEKITLEELKAKFASGEALKSLIHDKIYVIIEQFVEENIPTLIEKYVEELKGNETNLTDDLKGFIEKVAVDFAKSQATCYINGEATVVEGTVIEAFILEQVKIVLQKLLPHYAEMKKDPNYKFWESNDPYASVYVYAFNEMDDYIDTAIDNYIMTICGITPDKSTVLDDELQKNDTVNAEFNKLVSGELDKVIAYIDGGRKGTEPATYGIFSSALKSYFATTKIKADMLTADYVGFLEDNQTLFKDRIDKELSAIITYIENGRPDGEAPANYGVFATFVENYFKTYNTLDKIPSTILKKYINLDSVNLNFDAAFNAEYDKILAKQDTPLYSILKTKFDEYFTGKEFKDIDKILVSEYLAVKGDAIKTQYITNKIEGIDVDKTIENIVTYVKDKANGKNPTTVPDYYTEFKDKFDGKYTNAGNAVTLEDLEGNIELANAVLTTQNIEDIKVDFKDAVETAVTQAVNDAWDDIVAYAVNENPTPPAPDGYDLFVSEFNAYLTSNPVTFDKVGLDFLGKGKVRDFIKGKVDFKAELINIIDNIENPPATYDVFAPVFNDYIKNNPITLDKIDVNLIKDTDVQNSIINFDAAYAEILAYIGNNKKGTKPTTYDVFETAFNNYFATKEITLELVPSEIPLSFIKSYVNDANKKASLVAKFKETMKTANAQDKQANYDKILAILERDGDIVSRIDKDSLQAVINSFKTDDIVSAVKTIIENDGSYKTSFGTAVNSLSPETIVGFLEKMVASSSFDVNKMIDEVKGTFYDDQGNFEMDDDIYSAYLGLSGNGFNDKIVEFEDIIANEYNKTLVSIENDGAKLEMQDLLKYLKSISVNGNTIVTFGQNTSINKSAIKKLLKECIPTPEKIENMTEEEFKNFIHLEFEIVTVFSAETPITVKFDFDFSIGRNFSNVKKFVKAIRELVLINRENDKITLNVDLFDNFYDVLCEFATSDAMDPALRSELFGLMGLTSDEIYAYFSDINRFSFNKYKKIVSAINFEKIFENFAVTDVTNEQMVRYLCADEEKFEEFRETVLSYVDSVPESLKDKTVFNLYDGEGKFSISRKLTLSVAGVISKIEGMAPGLKDILSMVKGIAGNRSFSAEVEVNVSVPKLYSVTYVLVDPETGDEIERKSGLLPEGISLKGFFAPAEEYGNKVVERYDGYVITEWSETLGGDPVEKTIAKDGVVLYATLEGVKAEVSIGSAKYDDPDNITYGEYDETAGVVYDENTLYVLKADVIYRHNTHTPAFTYQWYKNGEAISGETEKTLILPGDVLNSGKYWCKVTVNDGAIEDLEVLSTSLNVLINPKPITIDDYELEWNYDSENPFVYDGKYHNVALVLDTLNDVNNKGLPHIEPASTGLYTNVEKINAGKYKARAHFVFVSDEDKSNYVFLNPDGGAVSDGYVECEWEILPQKITSAEGYKWSVEEGHKFTYSYGVTYSVSLTLPENLAVERYLDEAATYAGKYTTVAKIVASDSNYEWVGGELSLNWSIEKALFDLATVTWDYNAEEPYVYLGEDQSVFLSSVPADIVWLYTDNVAKDAGEYVASVEPDPNNALNNQNYIFKGKVPNCEWTIEKQSIETLLLLEWNYTKAFTYDGNTYIVELVIPEGFDERIAISYSDNTATDAGTYTATAKLVALDSKNFEVVGEENAVNFSCEWTIDKAKTDMSGVSFKDKTVYYTGEEFGIEIEGTLPYGVSVEYSSPVSEVGKYEMTATFVYNEVNFEPIAPMSATLTILPVYPRVNEFTSVDSNGNVIVDIKAQHGIPSNYQLNVKDLSVQYDGYDFGNLFGYGTNGKVLTVYDIHFAENGTETPFNDVFTVRLLLPKNFNGNINNVRVVHIGENGELTDMGAMIDGEYVAYETIHFSVYAIVEVVERADGDGTVDLYDLIPYAALALLVIILLIIIIAVIKKKRKKNKPEAPKTEEPKPEEPKPEEPKSEESEIEETIEPEAAEEAPVEEEKPSIVIHESVEDIPEEPKTEESESSLPASEIVHVRCRSSFTSRLIQSEPPIQDYYTILKNALLSYKGVKARMSFNFESFNSGRVQCAKLNVKGKSFLVYLGLDLEEYNVNKYHFTDASDKPKFEKVPMMLKVKSDRSLKYALELIDEVMKKNGFEKDPKFVEEDYHMPYETTAALAEKELVKLILPQGVSLADGIKLVKMDVGALLDEAKSGDGDDDED